MPEILATYQRQLMNVAQCAASLAVLLALAWGCAGWGRRVFRPVEGALQLLAARRALAIALVGLLSLLVGLSLTWITGAPIPRVHDEFSYLLAGDTFARGRLTNPPHPMWQHFETMHVLFQPTYASKFHPAQGLMLAFGQAMFGAPWVGVVISTALACAAMTWALFGWINPKWALLGGLLGAIHPQIVIWSHMYWGGSIAMLGGSLVLGAMPRILVRERVARHSAWLAMGGAILITARPFEAMVWGVLCAATLMVWLVRQRGGEIGNLVARLGLPALAILLPVILMLGYYNWRVTGNPRELPYTLHSRVYMAVPLLFWQEIPPTPSYRHKQLYEQHRVFEWHYFFGQASPLGWLNGVGWKIYSYAELHLLRNLPLLVGVVAIPCGIARRRWLWLPGVYLIGFLVAYASIPWFEHHYPAAILPAVFVLAMQGLRSVRGWRPGGRRVGQAFLWLCVVSTLPVLTTVYAREYRNNRGGWWYERHRIEQQLWREPGSHLVFVQYDEEHDVGHEWVYNRADIDGSRVVWARVMSPERDRQLMEYFSDRTAWMVYADEYPAVLRRREPQRQVQ